MIAGIMLGILCGAIAIVGPRTKSIETIMEEKRQAKMEKRQAKMEKVVVLDNPQSYRYRIGDIDWKEVERNGKK